MNIFKKLFDKRKIEKCYGRTKLVLIDKYLVDQSDEIYDLMYCVSIHLKEIKFLSSIGDSCVKVLMTNKFLECNMSYKHCTRVDGWLNLFYSRNDGIYRVNSDLKFISGYTVPKNILGYVLSLFELFRRFISKFSDYIIKIEGNPADRIMKVFIYKNDNGSNDYCDNKDNCITDDENLVAKLTYAFK